MAPPFFFRAILAVLLLLANGFAVAKPKIELVGAIRLAEKYVIDHKIPNRDRYLASVTWHEDLNHPEKSCWSIYWAPNKPEILDAQLVVWVCDDGKISYQDSWA
ncbi:hypothetical protein ABT364_03370 [Massilia sp. SR12]